MRKIKLYCKECNAKLTDALEEVPESLISEEDRTDLISDPNTFVFSEDWGGLTVKIDVYYLKNHPDSRRFQGCCGSSGGDGMNKTCTNGHEIATEFSDCYMPHFIVFDLDQIIIKEVSDQ